MHQLRFLPSSFIHMWFLLPTMPVKSILSFSSGSCFLPVLAFLLKLLSSLVSFLCKYSTRSEGAPGSMALVAWEVFLENCCSVQSNKAGCKVGRMRNTKQHREIATTLYSGNQATGRPEFPGKETAGGHMSRARTGAVQKDGCGV